MKPVDFLEELQMEHPDLAPVIAELASLYQKKLWHQLTVKLEACFELAAVNRADIPLRIFNSFILEFSQKMNLLKFGHFAVHASKFCGEPSHSIAFLSTVIEKLKEMKLHRSDQPILFLNTHIAQYKLDMGLAQDCRVLIESGREELEQMDDVDPSVSAAVYFVASLYYKSESAYADFYKSSLMYLSYVSSESLAADFKHKLAVDISLAALLADGVYSFGQLLQHPIVTVMDNSPSAWLADLLRCFNDGDMHRYEELCTAYAVQLNSQPALVASVRKLREKITIMCLLSLITALPAENRVIALTDIATATKLGVDGVEFLLMKALSLHLIEGSIDQVEGSVSVTWVQPRIMTKDQIGGLKTRLDNWLTKVTSAASALEHETVDVVAV